MLFGNMVIERVIFRVRMKSFVFIWFLSFILILNVVAAFPWHEQKKNQKDIEKLYVEYK